MFEIIGGIIGLLLLNISIKGIKKSVIRKWREGFFFLLAGSILLLIHSIGLIFKILPNFLKNVFLIVIIITYTYGIFSISESKLPD